MDFEKRARLIVAVTRARSIDEVYDLLEISPSSPEATYVEVVWEALYVGGDEP